MSQVILKQLAIACQQAAIADMLSRFRREYAEATLPELQSREQLMRFRIGLREREMETLDTRSSARLKTQQSLDCARAELLVVADLISELTRQLQEKCF
ncbi:MAG: hypothetical protein Q7S87_00950 [Agitococcus sp.]|nr:hypothetical protein [Agitococcus sp.]